LCTSFSIIWVFSSSTNTVTESCRCLCAFSCAASAKLRRQTKRHLCSQQDIGREASPEDGASVKDEARAIRQSIRNLPVISFWGSDEKVTSGSIGVSYSYYSNRVLLVDSVYRCRVQTTSKNIVAIDIQQGPNEH
jgi:hypothetical protein